MRLIHQLAVVAAALFVSGPLAAESFPTKPAKLIVNLATSVSTFTSSGGGRVTGVFTSQ